jgi:hypothetical protein
MRIVQLIDSLYIGGAERLQVTFAEVVAWNAADDHDRCACAGKGYCQSPD